jgi:hypothetical protein
VILRPRRLAVALAAGELSEREKFQYLLFGAIIDVLLPSQVAGWTNWTRDRVMFVAVSLVITVVGLLACFHANVRVDNRNFLERWLCLSFPLGIVLYVLYYVLYYAMGIAGLALGWVESDARNWNRDTMSVVSSITALSLFFLWMRASLLGAARIRAA